MKSAFTNATSLAAFLTCLVITLHSQQGVFRSKVDVVLLDVLPTERGRIVADLKQQDVEVKDNGTPQAITNFSTDTAGLGVYLLLDTSSSLTPRDLEHLRDGAQSLAAMLRAGDELSLLTFSQFVTLHGRQDAKALTKAFSGLKPEGNTALHDALTAGFRLSDQGGSSLRPVVMAFSDGSDTASWLQADNVLESARMSWSSFFAVTPQLGRVSLLEDLADLTGGEVIKLGRDLSTLPKVFPQILERLRQRYLIGFTPTSSAAGWHELDVKVKRAGVKVLARRGYLRR